MTNGAAGTDPEMHVIPTEECYRLLGTHEFGRIGVVADHYPLILPVNYRLDGTTVIIRTHPGTIERLEGEAVQRRVDGFGAGDGGVDEVSWRHLTGPKFLDKTNSVRVSKGIPGKLATEGVNLRRHKPTVPTRTAPLVCERERPPEFGGLCG